MTTNDNEEFSEEEKAFVINIMRDPVLFARHVLGVELWDREVEILRSIRGHRRTAVKACHAVGKTFTLAVGAVWWVVRYADGIVLTTSSTQRQVKTQLWSEIRRLVQRARVRFPDLKTTELKFRGEDNFAFGFSTDLPDNFQGYHGEHMLIIADEAPGIESGIWDAVAGTMAGGKVHIVMAGNPTVPSGAFFDAFARERGFWNCITISAFDSPNLAGLNLEQLLLLDPAEGGPLDQNPFPVLATKRWVYEHHFRWHRAGSPNWQSRVMAEFPQQAQDALIQIAWLERAKQRALENPVADNGTSPLVAGVDVGAGGSETVVYVCECKPDVRRIIAMGAWRAEDTRGEVASFLNRYRPRLTTVRVDSIGVGHNFALHLRDICRFPVELTNVARTCESKPQLGVEDPARRFVNQKAYMFQELADAFERNQVEGLTDEETIGQLAALLYEHDSQGRMMIESKERARARGVPSPDRAEALMLALGRTPPVYEYIGIPRRASERSLSSRYHYDDDHNPNARLRGHRRRWGAF